MPNVLPLNRQPGPGSAPDPRPLRRLRLYSRLLALFLAAIAALFTIAAAAVLLAMLVYDGPLLQIGPASMLLGEEAVPPGYVPFGSLPLLQRLVYVGVGISPHRAGGADPGAAEDAVRPLQQGRGVRACKC